MNNILNYILNRSNYIFLFFILIFFILNIMFNYLINIKDNIKASIKVNIKFNNYLITSINSKINLLSLSQRLIIILFHTWAFYIMQSVLDKSDIYLVALFYLASLFYIIVANIIINLVYKNSLVLLWNNIFFLISLSCIILFKLNIELAIRQLTWFYLGFLICIILYYLLRAFYNNNNNLYKFKNLYLITGLLLSGSTLILGNEDFGAKNWLTIFNITFQPSEITKLLFILYLSSSLCKPKLVFKDLVIPTIMSVVFILCFVLQNDLGSCLIFFILYLSLIYVSYFKVWIIGTSVVLFGIACRFAYNNFNHVKIRFDVWKDPWSSISTTGYQITQSIFAIVSYGLMGSGLDKGEPNKIPVVERDLIFSAICEEFGILFGIVLIIVLIHIFYIGFKIAININNNNNNFHKLVSFGIVNLICFQSFLTIGGSINFIPLTGVTLPFVSYGGSSILISFVCMGILQWIYINNKIR